MKKFAVIVLCPIIIALLGYLIFNSISTPMRFDQERKQREAVAVERLKDIRTLQVAFKSKFNRYTASFDTLIDFYRNGQLTIVKQIGSMDDSLAVAQKKVYRDSIKIFVRDTVLNRPGFAIDSLRWIPFSGGKQFAMNAVIRDISGVPVPLFEAQALFNDLLAGMNPQLIVNLNAERVAPRFAGVKVGSIEAPNNNAGNWE